MHFTRIQAFFDVFNKTLAVDPDKMLVDQKIPMFFFGDDQEFLTFLRKREEATLGKSICILFV